VPLARPPPRDRSCAPLAAALLPASSSLPIHPTWRPAPLSVPFPSSAYARLFRVALASGVFLAFLPPWSRGLPVVLSSAARSFSGLPAPPPAAGCCLLWVHRRGAGPFGLPPFLPRRSLWQPAVPLLLRPGRCPFLCPARLLRSRRCPGGWVLVFLVLPPWRSFFPLAPFLWVDFLRALSPSAPGCRPFALRVAPWVWSFSLALILSPASRPLWAWPLPFGLLVHFVCGLWSSLPPPARHGRPWRPSPPRSGPACPSSFPPPPSCLFLPVSFAPPFLSFLLPGFLAPLVPPPPGRRGLPFLVPPPFFWPSSFRRSRAPLR